MIKKLTNHILSYLISSNAIDDNKVIQKNRCFYYGSISNCSWSSQHDGKCL